MTTAADGVGAAGNGTTSAATTSASPASALPPFECTVLDEWIDYNGHMSEAFYVLAFGYATDAVMDTLGMDAAYRKDAGASLYTVEAHVRYLAETGAGAPLTVTTTVAGSAAKKLHLAHEMRSHPVVDQGAPRRVENGTLIATEELLALHVDSTSGRTSPFPDNIAADIDRLAEQAVPPDWVGRSVSL